MKIYISYPSRHLLSTKEWEDVCRKLVNRFAMTIKNKDETIEILNYHTERKGMKEDAPKQSLNYVKECIGLLSEADVVIMGKYFPNCKLCHIEHDCASAIGMEIINESRLPIPVIYPCNMLANEVKEEIKSKIDYQVNTKLRRRPCLSVIVVGNDAASQSYVRSKEKACEKVGIEQRTIHLDKDITQIKLNEVILEQSGDPDVDGILLQLPLPEHLDENEAINLINPEKDVDGLTPENLGRLLSNQYGFVPCTPLGCMAILDELGYSDLSGKKAVVCGRSKLVGKPVSLLLQQRNATVTVVHSKTEDLGRTIKQADILVVAVGSSKFVGEEWIKEGAVVIDVGINHVNGKLVGDCDTKSVAKKAAYVTPVPNGVGQMTVAMLLKNTYHAYVKNYAKRGVYL